MNKLIGIDIHVLRRRLLGTLLLLLVACTLDTAGAEQPFFLRGDAYSDLDSLQDALRANPDNIQVRASFERQKQIEVQDLIKQAQALQTNGDNAGALAIFRLVLQYDAANLRARNAVDHIATELSHAALLAQAGTLKTEKPQDALALVQQVLLDNPRNVQAQRLKNEIHGKRSAPAQLAAVYGAPVSLQFRDQTLVQVFDMIARISKVNFIFDRDVVLTQKVTVLARDTTVDDLINLLLSTYQLSKKVLNDNTLLIYPKRPDKDRDYLDLVMRTFYVSNADPKQVLAMLKQMVKTRDVYIDDRLSMIVMRDTPEVIEVAERLIAAMDLPQAEVEIDAQILEVTSSDLLNLGIQYPKSIGVTVGSDGVSSTGSVTSTPYNGTLSLAELAGFNRNNVLLNLGSPTLTANFTHDTGSTRILARPHIRVKNKEKAKILIGDRVPVVTNTNSNGVVSENINYQDVGLTLNVEPNISIDGDVSMKVTLEVSNIVDTITTQTGLLAYQIGTRRAETVMSSRDNETQMLGGLLSRNDQNTGSAIPGLGEVAILDRIFGTRSTSHDQTELVLLITPHVVRQLPLPSAYITQFDSGTAGVLTTTPWQLRSGSTIDIKGQPSGPVAPQVPAPYEPAPQESAPAPATPAHATAATPTHAPGNGLPQPTGTPAAAEGDWPSVPVPHEPVPGESGPRMNAPPRDGH